jgi:RNA polymerase sigma-70 factor (ECF subfamily)
LRQKALESLCTRYWNPVLHYVRRAWSKTHEDAKDLTQGFFLELLEGDALRKYSPDRASFRTYLKMLLSRYSADQNDLRIALKRGGGRRIVPIDAGESSLQLADPQAESPEKVFDQAWKAEIFKGALERARRHFSETKRDLQFLAFVKYELSNAKNLTYADIAEELGLQESDIRNYLVTVKERFREDVRAELADTVGDVSQLEDEFNSLFGG